jgi:hypothetical protein
LKFVLQLLQILVGKRFQVYQVVARSGEAANNFIELKLDCFGVAVLGVLDQEDHQESHDCRARVDDQLPGIE